MADIVDILKDNKAFNITQDGNPLSISALQNMTASNLNNSRINIKLYDMPLALSNEQGKVGCTWNGAYTEAGWVEPAMLFLQDLYDLTKCRYI